MSIADIQLDEKIKIKVAEPKSYKVVFLNDDVTPFDFVNHLLVTIFKHSDDVATKLTEQIHNNGSAVVGTYRYEIAEQKGFEATQVSRAAGFPLQIKVEQE